MNASLLDTALNRLFHEQGRRIVFWNDPEREFEDRLAVPDITLLLLDQQGALAVKIHVEGCYLIYTSAPPSDFRNGTNGWKCDAGPCRERRESDYFARIDP
jgi:hypothetical protein